MPRKPGTRPPLTPPPPPVRTERPSDGEKPSRRRPLHTPPGLLGLSVPDAAQAWAAAGFAVFPCVGEEVDPVRGKWAKKPHPMLRAHGAARGVGGWKLATTDPEQIEKWWDEDPTALIGIPPGSAGAAVLDCDGDQGIADVERIAAEENYELTDTFLVMTPGGGVHVWFDRRLNTGVIGNGRLHDIAGEARADRGYVIAPPSVLPNGRGYAPVAPESYSDSSVFEMMPLPEWAGFCLPWDRDEDADRASIADVTTGDELEWMKRHSVRLIGSRPNERSAEELDRSLRAIAQAADHAGHETMGRYPTATKEIARILTLVQGGHIKLDLQQALGALRQAYLDIKPKGASEIDRFIGDALALRVAEDRHKGLGADEIAEVSDEEAREIEERIERRIAQRNAEQQPEPAGDIRISGEERPASDMPSLPPDRRIYKYGDSTVTSAGQLPSAVYEGPIGEWLTLMDGATEATQPALGLAALSGLGAWMGPDRKLEVPGARPMSANLFGVVVGPSAIARKGTAQWNALELLRKISPGFIHIELGGFSSGEALVTALADPITNDDGLLVSGRRERRGLILEDEFSRVLEVAARDRSTLSAMLRQIFDNATLSRRVAAGTTKASGHCVSMFAGITPEELLVRFTALSATNGLGNRMLWAWSESTVDLPQGGPAVDVIPIARRLATYIKNAPRQTFTKDAAAQAWWEQHYHWMKHLPDVSPTLRPVVRRASDQIGRVALIYAVSMGAPHVTVTHLEAGLAWMRYSIATVQGVLGGLVMDETQARIMAALRAAEVPVNRRDLHSVLSRHALAGEIDRALERLSDAGLCWVWTAESSGGRPPVMAIATVPVAP